jgi:hypothetical protein
MPCVARLELGGISRDGRCGDELLPDQRRLPSTGFTGNKVMVVPNGWRHSDYEFRELSAHKARSASLTA